MKRVALLAVLVFAFFVGGFVSACGSARTVTETLSAQPNNTYAVVEDGTT